MIDFKTLNEETSGVKALCLEARHSISREIAKKRRQRFESSIFIPKIYSRNISPFKMASEDEGSPKSYRDECKSRFKSVNSVSSRHSKQLLDRKRLQHPESFPLSKKSVAKQVFSAVENFRGSTYDSRKLKDFGVRRNHSLSMVDDSSFSSSKNRGKSWKFKSLSNQSSEGGNSLKYHPEKFTVEVVKVRNKKDDAIPLSGTNSTDSAIPNFIICCTPEIKQPEDCKRTRPEAGCHTSVEELTSISMSSKKQKTKNASMKLYNTDSVDFSRQSQPKDVRKRVSSCYSIQDSYDKYRDEQANESMEDDNCDCTCSSERLDDYQESQEQINDTCGCLDSCSDPQVCEYGSESDNRRSSTREENLRMTKQPVNQTEASNEESESEGPDLEENSYEGANAEDRSLEISKPGRTTGGDTSRSEGGGESSDEMGETDDCQQDIQNDTALSYYDPKNTYNNAPTCPCCCDPGAIPNNQDLMRMNSEYNGWPQMQNGNACFPYSFCCPEGNSSYFGCCCPGAPMSSSPSMLAPTDVPAMSTIQSPLQSFQTQSFDPPDRDDVQPSTSSERSSGGKSSRSSTQFKQRNESAQSKKSRYTKGSPSESSGSQANTSSSLENNQSASSPSRSSVFKRPDENVELKSDQNPQAWAAPSNNFGCYSPTPFYGCNMCPSYQSIWCPFPWWYSLPFGFDQCYNPMVAPSTNNFQMPQPLRQVRPGSQFKM